VRDAGLVGAGSLGQAPLDEAVHREFPIVVAPAAGQHRHSLAERDPADPRIEQLGLMERAGVDAVEPVYDQCRDVVVAAPFPQNRDVVPQGHDRFVGDRSTRPRGGQRASVQR